MGMAASQVRFLSLQNRKNTIGLNLMTLSNRKMALSRDMSRIANEYNNAMNLKTLKWSGDSGITYSDLSYDTLMKPNNLNSNLPYIVTDEQGRVVLDDNVIELDGFENKNQVTYRDLAMMISAYSGLDDQGHTTYNNLGNLTGGENITSEDIKGGVVGNDAAEAKASSGKANELGYEIVSTASQTGSNTLRYDLMEQLGLISKADADAIEDLELELYGPSRKPDADKFPVDSLMGKYYLAEANLEAYKNFAIYGGDFQYSAGVDTLKSGANDGANDPKLNKNSITDPNNPAYKPDKVLDAIDGSGPIKYVNNYNTASSTVTFNGQSYLSKVDLTGVNENGTIFTNSESNFSYSISNGGITYTNTTNDILSMMGNVNYSVGAYKNNRGNHTGDVKDMSWQELINGNYAIDLHWKINDTNCERSDYEQKVRDFVGAMANGIRSITAIEIDSAAIDKAEESTEAFFLGDITNGGNNIEHRNHADTDERGTIDTSIDLADDYNLVGEGYKVFCFYPWKINRASHQTTINAKNVYNTLITFYQYFYHTPDANAITDSSGGSFEAGSAGTSTNEVTGIDTSQASYDESKNVWFQSGTQWYVRKEMSGTQEIDGESYSYTIYHYYKTNSNGGAAIGAPVQEDQITSASDQVQRIIKNADGSYSNYSMAKSSYNQSNSTSGGRYVGSNGWTAASSGGSTGSVANGVLVLTYKDEFGNDVTLKLGNKVSESVYATSLSGQMSEEEINKNLEELTKKRDEAKKAVDDAETKKARYFDSTENKMMDYFDALFKMIAENGWVYDASVNNPNDKQGSQDYLNAKLQNNMYFITEVDTLDGTDFNYATKLANNVSKIFEVYDKDAQNAALSKYEADKADITAKEKQVDIRMNKLEAEQDAISTELDSIKKIIDDNVSNTFKIFT